MTSTDVGILACLALIVLGFTVAACIIRADERGLATGRRDSEHRPVHRPPAHGIATPECIAIEKPAPRSRRSPARSMGARRGARHPRAAAWRNTAHGPATRARLDRFGWWVP